MIGQYQWILRTARLHAADPARRSGAGLVRAMGAAKHRAQVTRWENGQVALTHSLVRRYEQALDLPEGQLLRAIDLIARENDPLMSLPAVPAPPSDDVVGEAMPILERALQYEPMTGLDWDRLTTLMASTSDVLLRRNDWETLIYRLGLETSLSTGLEYVHRWESSARMVSNRRMSDVVLEMTESALTDGDMQLYSDYATVLRYCPDPRGHELLLQVIRRPPNAAALWASLSTVTTLVRHGLVVPHAVEATIPTVLEIALDETLPMRTRRAAASFLDRARCLVHTDRLASRQRHVIEGLLTDGGLSGTEQASILERTLEELAREVPSDAEDGQLHNLLRTALREPHLDVRDTALGVLMLSGQGRTLGSVLADDLASAVDAGHRSRAAADLSMLSWLVQPAALPQLTRLTTGESGWDDLTTLAGAAVGNSEEPLGPARESRDSELFDYAVARISARADDPGAPPGNHWGTSYALGMRGRFDLLEQLVGLPGLRAQDPWRTSVSWWVDLPPAVRPNPAGRDRDAGPLEIRGVRD